MTTYFIDTFLPRYEGICKKLKNSLYSSLSDSFDSGGQLRTQDSIDEEFHENLIYHETFIAGRSGRDGFHTPDVAIKLSPYSSDGVVPSVCLISDRNRLSPFASNDSLNNDVR